MSNSKFSTSVSEHFLKPGEFEFSDRTVVIDYPGMKVKATALVGRSVFAWAVKLCCAGRSLRPHDYVKIGSFKMTADEFKKLLTDQPGYVASTSSRGLDFKASKELVTVSRLCRAFASDVIRYLKDAESKGIFIDDVKRAHVATGSAYYLCFLDAPYGMSDKDLAIDGMFTQLERVADYYNIIAQQSQEWAPGTKRVDHVKKLKDYYTFRGVKIVETKP